MLSAYLVWVCNVIPERHQEWLHQRGIGLGFRCDLGCSARDELRMRDHALPELF
jgi:hypothetical protein